jgi:HEPN domain-containing protein
MDKAYRTQAEECFERGRHDIETAQLLYDEQGYTDSIAYHTQQGVEKYLKGYLVLHGRKPPRIHELDALHNRIAAFDESFNDFLELCEKASRYYIEDRYLPGPLVEYEYNEIKADLDQAWELIRKILARASDRK